MHKPELITKELFFVFAKAIGLTLFFVGVFFFLTVVGIGAFTYYSIQQFSTAAGVTPQAVVEELKDGWSTPVLGENQKLHVLILGTDQLSTRGDAPVLTDTILLSALDFRTGNVTLLSLPRDTWLPEYQARINALYMFGKQRFPEEPHRLPKEAITQLTGVRIDHVVVVNIESVGQLVDQIGGIELDVPVGFVDELFPRPDVDVTTERDPAKLYQRVEFQTGQQHMTGERALQYIRSRHATGAQGDDTARAQRQQQVIMAVVRKLQAPSFYLDLPRSGKLYAFYKTTFEQYISFRQLVAILRKLYPVRKNLSFSSQTISIYPQEAAGVLFHPPVTWRQPQWIYQIRDLEMFRKEIQQKLSP